MSRRLVINLSFILGIFLYSCDNREESISGYNTAPILEFTTGSNKSAYIDSVKLSLKNTNKASEFYLTYFDVNKNIKEVKYTIEGAGRLTQDDSERSGSLDLSGKNKIVFEPSTIGKHTIRFTAIDQFKSEKSVSATIYAFSNLSPIADINVRPVKVASPLEHELDASNSIDADAKFGGGIISYIFYVNNRILLKTNEPKIKYVFPEVGNFIIKVIVTDVEGVNSEIERTVVIQ